ncbi:MAG: hypothetical protein ACQEQO_11770, partial [Thermodesulfobacteriota bacterium]
CPPASPEGAQARDGGQACPVKQPAGLPDEDRGFTGELLCFQLPVADRCLRGLKKGIRQRSQPCL